MVNYSHKEQVGEETAMWLADQWKDYEVIDCSGGEKLERWGKYILLRPDPQLSGYAEEGSTLEEAERPLPSQQKGRRRVGIF